MIGTDEVMLETPFFLIDEAALRRNLEIIGLLRERSGARIVLALKCFSTWGVFDIMRPFLDGTTSSSLYEARLGHETFGGETHAYSVGFRREDVLAVDAFADKVIFNSISQLEAHRPLLQRCRSVGLRVNPGISYARQTLADPARRYSRLGVRPADLSDRALAAIDGVMFHFNCENRDADGLLAMLDRMSVDFAAVLGRVDWVSLGGGMLFTAEGFPLERFADGLRAFGERHAVQVYLEPGEAVITQTTDLVVTIVDIVRNERTTAIVDSATEAHRLDTLIYDEPASVREAREEGSHEYIIGSSSCLAGDIFCSARFDAPLEVGDRLHLMDSAGYTMVKLNWFNGLRMPSVHLRRPSGAIEQLNELGYDDFRRMLSSRMATPAEHEGAGAR